MLTLEELQSLTINADVAREAFVQSDRYLAHTLAVQSSYEQKAATLMSAYITISVALFGIGGAIFKDSGVPAKIWPFFATGLVFILGASCFIVAIKVSKYAAAVGSTPEMWLRSGVIDGGENAVPAMLAYLTYYHSERIEISGRTNIQKARWIDAGIILGALAPLCFLLLFLTL
jgi:hypothetical protein